MVVGTALLLCGNDDSLGAGLHTNRVAGYLGDISYSLYLWHFPVVVAAHAIWGSDRVIVALGSAAVMLALSALSYRYVETPARHSSWLRSWERHEPAPMRRQALVGAAIAAALVVAVAWQANPVRTLVLAERTFPISRVATAEPFSDTTSLAAAVTSGLSGSVRDVIPAADDLSQAQLSVEMDDCTNDAAVTTLRVCSYPGSGRSYALVGDSVALAWAPAVRAAIPNDADLTVIGIASSSPWTTTHGATFSRAGFPAQCDRARELLLTELERRHPDVVLVSSAAGEFPLQLGASSLDDAWRDGAITTLTRLTKAGSTPIVLGCPPTVRDPRLCLNRLTQARGCTSKVDRVYERKAKAEHAAAQAVGVAMIDVRTWMCAGSTCPLTVGHYLTRTDTTHVTAAFAAALGPVLRQELVKEGQP